MPRSRLALLTALVPLTSSFAVPTHAFDFVVTEYSDDPLAQDPGCTVDHCTLREAVIAANAGIDADRILLSAGRYERTLAGAPEDLAANGDLDLFEDVEIVGPGATMATIDGNGIEMIFQVYDAQFGASPPNVRFEGLTLVGGTGSGTDPAGISVGRAVVVIEACELRDSVGGSGLVASAFSDLTVRRSTISGHPVLGIAVVQSEAHFENVTLTGNGSAELQSTTFAAVECVHCTISDPGDVDASVLLQSNGVVTMTNSVVAGQCLLQSEGTLTSSGGNLESPGHTCTLGQGTDQVDVTAGELALAALADNGGATRTKLPGILSFANSGADDSLCAQSDQRGVTRGEEDCESGAVERTSAPVGTPIFHDGFLQGDPEAWSDAIGEEP